jgi:hypothetical protein
VPSADAASRWPQDCFAVSRYSRRHYDCQPIFSLVSQSHILQDYLAGTRRYFQPLQYFAAS